MIEPIHGSTIRWKFEDGPTAGKRFEHEFKDDGSVAYRMEGSDKPTTEKKYEVEQVSENVFAVAYLAKSGWTLTTLLDFETGKVVSFASNDKQLVVQHGEFQVISKHAA
jgi:uncharacterized protein YcnI